MILDSRLSGFHHVCRSCGSTNPEVVPLHRKDGLRKNPLTFGYRCVCGSSELWSLHDDLSWACTRTEGERGGIL